MQGLRRKHKHPRAQTSCAVCHQRKVKFDAKKPCDQCTRRGQIAECVYKYAPQESPHIPSETSAETLPADVASGHQDWDAEPRWSGADVEMVQPRGVPSTPTSYPSIGSQSLLIGDSVSNYAGTQRSESRLPTQDWTRGSPVRGRSHSSWAVQLFGPLVAYLDETNSQDTRRKDEIPLLERSYEQWKRRKLEARDTMLSVRLSDELPPAAIVRTLIERYFATFHIIFPVLDQAAFTSGLESTLQNPLNIPVHLLVQVMLLLVFANGTYRMSQAPIPQWRAFVWIDLASSVPTIAFELNEFSVDTLRVIAFLNIAKQVLKFNETANYIYSNAGIRFTMMLGFNRFNGLKQDEIRL